MALPAGRRGIRADLVKSDGTIIDLTKLKEDFAALSASDIPTIDVPLFKSLTGNPVTISDAVGENAKCAKATLEPIQDLHGYDHPWAGGAGKNLLPMIVDRIKAINTFAAWNGNTITNGGVSVTILTDTDNNVIGFNVNGTSTGIFYLRLTPDNFVLPAGTYALSCVGNNQNIYAYNDGHGLNSYNDKTETFDSEANYKFYIRIASGVTFNNLVVKPMLEAGSVVSTFEPYSNICPISGRTQVEITNKDSEDVEQASVTVDLGQTVYGGTLNVTTGELTVESAYIASYNGESIGELWWSSMDEYVAGATPTTGAQVVYTLATPITVSLTPAQIQLLTTTNIISTNADVLSILYRATEEGNVEGALQYLFDKVEELSAQINE